MNSRKKKGIMMASIGGIILLVTALSMVFNWDIIHPAFAVIGITFLGAGMAFIRKS